MGPVREASRPISLEDRDLVGGVVALRGAWWGVVIVRCDRTLAEALVDGPSVTTTDAVLRALAVDLGSLVKQHIDPTARLGDAVGLAADDARWQPSYAVLQLRVDVQAGRHLMVVEVRRRRRSDEMPTEVGRGT